MAEAALARAGATDIHPRTPVKDLPLSRRQMVEIAKALARDPRILILDEATSALTAADVERVLALLRRLRDEGLALAYISHRMHEIAEISPTIARSSAMAATSRPISAGTKSHDEVVELMIGREYRHVFPPKPAPRRQEGPPRLELRGLSWTNRLKDISLTASAGEIVGLGGLDGQGQRELLLAMFGALRGLTGEIRIEGTPVGIGSPRQAKGKRSGMALIPEDRKTEGLMLPMSVGQNLSFAALDDHAKLGIIDRSGEARAIRTRDRRAVHQGREGRDAGGLAFGRQSAEGRDRQMADDRAAHHPSQRPHTRDRRRHQTGDIRPVAPSWRTRARRSCSIRPTTPN